MEKQFTTEAQRNTEEQATCLIYAAINSSRLVTAAEGGCAPQSFDLSSQPGAAPLHKFLVVVAIISD
jgi:hypothetical protein